MFKKSLFAAVAVSAAMLPAAAYADVPCAPPVAPMTHPIVSGFGQVAAAPVYATAPINQLVGSVGAPLINVDLACVAPWLQGGVGGNRYNACNTAPVDQANETLAAGPLSPPAGAPMTKPLVTGFGQVAAAPVYATAPIHQLVGSVGGPLVNVVVSCAAPWNQGGVGDARYNACNTAPVDQENAGPTQGNLLSGLIG